MSNNDNKLKKKLPKKEVRILKRKNILTYGIISVVAIAGILGGIFLFREPQYYPDLIIGANCGIWIGVDPLNTFIPTDYDIISQAAEGLFDYAPSSSNSVLIHNLAISHNWSVDNLNLTCSLRRDVKFHDGTNLNAAAVKWNFDRLYNFIDLGGINPFTGIYDLWLFPDGVNIINDTEIIDEYTIRFILNKPYIPLPGLLTTISSYILSPTSTPFDEFIPSDGKIIGTGPFIYEEYLFNEKITFSSNPFYWNGKPKIDNLIYKVFTNKTERYDALISGEVTMLSSWNQIWNPNPDSVYYDNSIDIYSFFNHGSINIQEGPSSFFYFYLIMNNELIPVEMREAISYTLDYSSIIHEIINDYGVRSRSPLPEGLLYSNITDIEYPYYNISEARNALKEAGWPGTSSLIADNNITVGNPWEMLVTNNTPLASYNFSYTSTDILSQKCIPLFEGYFKQIGIKFEPVLRTDVEMTNIYSEQYGYHLNMIELSILGFNGPKFNDPSCIINHAYSNKAVDLNYCQVNDSLVQQWMEAALEESNTEIRAQLYYDIQKRLCEEIYPKCILFCKNFLSIFRSNLKGWQIHQFKSNFKDVYFT